MVLDADVQVDGVATAAAGPTWTNGADVTVSFAAPLAAPVGQARVVSLTITNIGTQNASNVGLVVDLPRTANSPTPFVMGTAASPSTGCVISGLQLRCANLGTVARRGGTKAVTFQFTPPHSAGTLALAANVTASNETASARANNAGAGSILRTYPQTDLVASMGGASVAITNRHCTGTGLTAFYECTLAPSSITAHPTTFHTDGSISFDEPGYTGTWEQTDLNGAADTTYLRFRYFEAGQSVAIATFEGRSVAATGVFHGITTFPGSGYVSPYEVVLP